MRLNCLYGKAVITAALAMTSAAAPAMAAAPVTRPDATFLKSIHQGNLAEIAASRDARTHAASACVKQVAGILVRDHTMLDAQGAALARSKRIALPSAPTTTQQRQLAGVKGLHGTRAYR